MNFFKNFIKLSFNNYCEHEKTIKKIVVLVSALIDSMISFVDGHGKILFSIKGPGSGNPFWASVTKGAEEEAKKLGVVNLGCATSRR